jgi:CxxC motif-containing protein
LKGFREVDGREFTCIGCPIGCDLFVEMDENKNIIVVGYGCKIGENYGVKEFTNPIRIITTSVKVVEGEYNQVSVKSEKGIIKNKIFDCLKVLKNIEVKAPINIGDVIYEDIEGTKVNIVATKNVKKII